MLYSAQAQMLVSEIQIFQKLALTLPDKKVLKMLVRMSAITRRSFRGKWGVIGGVLLDKGR